MTPSLILRTSAPLLLWLLGLVSLYVLVRGHDAPGGGFIGGLIASAGIVFSATARGTHAALRVLRVHPAAICGAGLLVAAASGVPALLDPQAGYLTHYWWFPAIGVEIPVGTTLVFDLGVYMTVLGTVCAMFLSLAES